ncbi:methylenetetrahydrofolate reductase [Actinomyces haliotis]|uniref:methylenetetrahydrofolate reductase n=1 Tax=Actinomyces haliotis TaxID=1280843 RepID=UPI00189091F5|nr:methylenetetrahydrofolate reductase [Actinomyces haliotis]
MIDPSVRHVGAAAPVRPSLSLELFPPRPGPYASQTWGALDRLLAAGPDFASVTYRPTFVTTTGGAPPVASPGGSAGGDDGRRLTGAPTRVHVVREHNPSEDVVAHVLARSDVPLMTHLTCIGYKKANVVEIVRLFLSMGVRRFLALRGDPPRGVDAEDVVGEIRHADELVRIIREVESEYFDDGERHVQISVATYPASVDHGREVEVLAAKQAAGADLAITQVFYDSEDYLALGRAACYSGVTLPILPGIIPMTDLRRLTRLEALSGVPVPGDLRTALESAHGAGTVSTGIDATLRLATEVLDGGAPGLHLYTFNRTRPALDVIAQLRLGRILTGDAPDRVVQREVRHNYLNAVPGGSTRITGRMPVAARP